MAKKKVVAEANKITGELPGIFMINRHNLLFRKYMTKLAFGIKNKNQDLIQEVKEYMKTKNIDIGYNEDSQKIRLRQVKRIPVDFSISEFVNMSNIETASV
jgi:hypothetical protein